VRSLTRSDAASDSASALSLQYHGIWRRVDDRLSPTRGRVWTGQFGVGQAHSDPGGNGPFTRLYARLNAYLPIGDWYGQARVEVGQVLVKDGVRVPESLRFRAGGDESVRGYAYRSLAPTENGVVVSGKVLFTASVELARPLLASQPGLMGAVFVDAGRAAQGWKGLHPALGYGFGVRYGSPVGQLKLDLAWGQEVHRLRLHLGVGVPF
jgi:translocation and assembly module TamA